MKKINFPVYLLICVTAIIGLVWTKIAWKKKHLFDNQTKEFFADIVTTNDSSLITNQAIEYFKVFAYPENGDYAVANADKSIVTLKDKYNQTIWSVKVKSFVQSISDQLPNQFENEVQRIYFATNELWGRKIITNQFIVMVGKTCLGLNRENGKINYYGSN